MTRRDEGKESGLDADISPSSVAALQLEDSICPKALAVRAVVPSLSSNPRAPFRPAKATPAVGRVARRAPAMRFDGVPSQGGVAVDGLPGAERKFSEPANFRNRASDVLHVGAPLSDGRLVPERRVLGPGALGEEIYVGRDARITSATARPAGSLRAAVDHSAHIACQRMSPPSKSLAEASDTHS